MGAEIYKLKEAFVNDLSYKTITTANVEYYAKIVQEKAIKRFLHQ